jgi:hypothetical protein
MRQAIDLLKKINDKLGHVKTEVFVFPPKKQVLVKVTDEAMNYEPWEESLEVLKEAGDITEYRVVDEQHKVTQEWVKIE